ncbi:MAG TPA: alpha/beta hydrolase [Candidatus Dormibacteraeota bacterium]
MEGPETGPPVLLLHGGGQTRHAWGGTRARLAAAGWRAISVDLRGHGDSDWAPDGDYGPPVFAADVRALIDWTGGRPALVGASLGGQAALLAVGESDEATPIARALVLVDVTPRVNLDGARRVIGFMRSRPDGFASLEEAADAVAAYLPHRPRPDDTAGLARNLRYDGARYRWHWDPVLVEQSEQRMMPAERLLAAARRIRVPTLLIRGALSDVVTEDTAGEFMRLLPDAEFVTVDRAAHMVAGDRNDVFTAAVLDFLSRRSSDVA